MVTKRFKLNFYSTFYIFKYSFIYQLTTVTKVQMGTFWCCGHYCYINILDTLLGERVDMSSDEVYLHQWNDNVCNLKVVEYPFFKLFFVKRLQAKGH